MRTVCFFCTKYSTAVASLVYMIVGLSMFTLGDSRYHTGPPFDLILKALLLLHSKKRRASVVTMVGGVERSISSRYREKEFFKITTFDVWCWHPLRHGKIDCATI